GSSTRRPPPAPARGAAAARASARSGRRPGGRPPARRSRRGRAPGRGGPARPPRGGGSSPPRARRPSRCRPRPPRPPPGRGRAWRAAASWCRRAGTRGSAGSGTPGSCALSWRPPERGRRAAAPDRAAAGMRHGRRTLPDGRAWAREPPGRPRGAAPSEGRRADGSAEPQHAALLAALGGRGGGPRLGLGRRGGLRLARGLAPRRAGAPLTVAGAAAGARLLARLLAPLGTRLRARLLALVLAALLRLLRLGRALALGRLRGARLRRRGGALTGALTGVLASALAGRLALVLGAGGLLGAARLGLGDGALAGATRALLGVLGALRPLGAAQGALAAAADARLDGHALGHALRRGLEHLRRPRVGGALLGLDLRQLHAGGDEVDLPLRGVGRHDLHLDAVAEAVALARVLAHQHQGVLEVEVVVVLEVADVHQPLHAVGQLQEHPEVGDAHHGGREGGADLLLGPARVEVAGQVALGLLR